MGNCTSSGGGSGGGGAGGIKTSSILPGERSFAKLNPTWLNPDGQTVIVTDSDGRYIWKVGFDKNDYKIDQNSNEYKRALSDYNIRAQFNSDGTVMVTRGGLFDKKRTFKSVEAFQKEAESRIDRRIKYYEGQANLTKRGIISQIEAESFKSNYRNDEINAVHKFNNYMKQSILSSRTQAAAGQDMKERLQMTIEQAKKKRKA